MKRAVVLTAALALLLTACAPTPDDKAWRYCVELPTTLYQLEHPDASSDEFIDAVAGFADDCQAQFDADPADFNQRYREAAEEAGQ